MEGNKKQYFEPLVTKHGLFQDITQGVSGRGTGSEHTEGTEATEQGTGSENKEAG